MTTTDEERFSALFADTHGALLSYALRRVQEPADAADVVAETYLVAWRRLADVPRGDETRPWLYGVARRVLANQSRGEQRRHALADRLRESLTEAAAGHVPVGARLTHVEQAIADLPAQDQEVLRLLVWEELGRDEIATALGVSRATVRVRLHRARRRLRDRLAARAAERPADEVGHGPGSQRAGSAGHVLGGWASARPGVEVDR